MNNKDIFKAIGLVSAGVAAGSTCTYLSVRKHFKNKYEQFADEEIKSVKRSYALLRKEGPYSDPATAIREYEGRVQDLQYAAADATVAAEEQLVEQKVQDAAEEQKLRVQNIFDDQHTDRLIDAMERQDTVSTEQMLSMRESERQDGHDPDSIDQIVNPLAQGPYVITKDQYFDEADEFEKLSLLYYEGDLTLTDDQDKIIRDVAVILGSGSLSRFGDDSGDPNIVFVRNERLNVDYEVTRDDREYTEVVLGIKSDPAEYARRIRRMRDDE